MKRMRSSNGYEDSRRENHSVNHDRLRETQRLHARSASDGRERAYQNEEFDSRFEQRHPDFLDDEGSRFRSLERENGMSDTLNFARAIENRQRHRSEEQMEEEMERSSRWTNEDDVKAEMKIRGSKRGTGRTGRGNDTMDEWEQWRKTNRIGTAAQRGRGSYSDDGSWGQGRRRMSDRAYHN